MFSFDAEAKTIHLYDEIGPDWAGMISAGRMVEALDAMDGEDITIYLMSPGGSVDEGTTIYETLRRYEGKKTIIVDSIAASMASYILQAADHRVVAENSKVMIHNPWGIALGDSSHLRKEADILDKYTLGMVPGYAKRTGKSEDEIRAIMDAETWYLGKEIVDAGFADEVAGKASKKVDTKAVYRWSKAVPDRIKADLETPLRDEAIAKSRFMTVAAAKELIAKVR